MSKVFSSVTASCFVLSFLLLVCSTSLIAQEMDLKTSVDLPTSNDARSENVSTCVPPSALSYTVNNAFYCTGLPITPNALTYLGTTFTTVVISPDLPVGLSFNTVTGTITGTPTVAVAGNYTVIMNNPCGFTSRTLYIAVSSGTNYYADADGDGFGTGTPTVSCSGQPANTATNNTDCEPSNPSKWRTSNLFVDADGDRFSNGFPAVPICYGAAVPSGYTVQYIGTDCMDTNIDVNPNANEVPGNSIDDNCDGFIDEITTTSYLIATSCGIAVPTLSTTLYAQPVSGSQGYRFEVRNGFSIGVFETNVNSFNLLNLSPGVSFSSASTTNSVRVAVKVGGFWRAFGLPCIVNTPAVPNSTSISNPVCGSFLRDIWNTLFCYQIPTATGYRFRVKRNGILIGVVEKTVNNFSMVELGISNLLFATTYTVDILLKMGSSWLPDSEYGISCVIITPPTPGVSRISIPSCGSSTNNLWQTIYAVPIQGGQGYKFVFDNGIRYREYITPSSSMSIQNIPGGPMVGTTYSIRVDILHNSRYVVGTETCTLNILPTATRLAGEPLKIFEIKSIPNPFSNNFQISINSSSEDIVEMKVYDMFGRTIASYRDSIGNIENLALGENYPSGVYNLVIIQGESTKTLKVIKR